MLPEVLLQGLPLLHLVGRAVGALEHLFLADAELFLLGGASLAAVVRPGRPLTVLAVDTVDLVWVLALRIRI